MRPLLTIALCLGLALVCQPAVGDAVHKLRVMTMMPVDGPLGLKKWKRDVETASGGRLKLRILPWRFAQTDRETIVKLRSGKLDAANIGMGGLSSVVRQANILTAWGTYRDARHYARAQRHLWGDIRDEAYRNGLRLLSSTRTTNAHIASRKPVRRPQDLVGQKAWYFDGDAGMRSIYELLGVDARPVALPLVATDLREGRLDMVYASALSLMSMGWFTHMRYLTRDAFSGARRTHVMARRRFESLPPELSEIFATRSKELNESVAANLRREDKRTLDKLLTRGLRPVELDRKAWRKIASRVRKHLIGREYTEEMLKRVDRL